MSNLQDATLYLSQIFEPNGPCIPAFALLISSPSQHPPIRNVRTLLNKNRLICIDFAAFDLRPRLFVAEAGFKCTTALHFL